MKLKTQCDDVQNNETSHFIQNSTKTTFQMSLTLAAFIVFGNHALTFKCMFATHFQKVRDLFTAELPRNILQPDLEETITVAVKAERVPRLMWDFTSCFTEVLLKHSSS